MMSNVTSGMTEPTNISGQTHAGQRNVQFRVSASQQQHQHHHHHNQLQQHDASGHVSSPANTQSSDPAFLQQPRSVSTSSLSQQHGQQSQQSPQQHSTQYSHFGSNSQSQQHQQRPPIPPTHQPRLHHSVSAGNIAMAANASRYGPSQVGIGPNVTGVVQPKKKDPYATAWRTYSKIAEELQLLNPDGSLYPISKEAILKYLHHQSKRIKSSNLHWYVNGLKKHQENLGFPWDDVRYDEQVVGLLKELTLHPVTAAENGEDDTHNQGHGPSYGSGTQSTRQRQSSSGTTYPLGKSGGSGHHYSSSSIDTTRIANLSISQQPPSHNSPPQQSQQQQQRIHNSSYGAGGLKQQHQGHQPYMQQQQQQIYHQSQRNQPPPGPKPHYRSAPIQLPPSQHSRTPSSQEPIYQGVGVGHHHLQGQSGTIQLVDSLGSRSDPLGASSSALAKRKRNELEFRKRRVTSSTGLEPADNDDDELRDEDLMNEDDELDGRRGNEGNDLDDMEEDSNRYQPLKRRASTGTLLSQARASSVKHIPGPFATDSQKSGLHLHQKSTYPEAPLVGIIRHENHHLRSPSPDPRDDDLAGHYSHVSGHVGLSQIRGSPPDSVSSTSSLGGVQHNHAMDAETRRHRHLSGGSGMDRTTGSLSSPTSATTPTGTGSTGKTTVHFSEVVECAQLLQAKYGNRCKDHPWGCVEITEERHLELTIKMYLDWAGLVASGRLTMDELPDLPEFRSIRPLAGGTLRRMASTPLTSSLLNAPTGTVATTEKIITNTVDSSLTGRLRGSDEAYSTVSSSGRAFFGPYRSPSSSPPSRQHSHIYQQQQQQQREKGPVSEEGSLTPALDTLRRPVTSPPQGGSSIGGGVLRGARKMPSTPILRQHHQYHHHHGDRTSLTRHIHPRVPSVSNTISRHRGHVHAESIVSNSTASSPVSEADMSDEDDLIGGDHKSAIGNHSNVGGDEGEDEDEDDDDDEDEEEEEIDVSHYALSPWAAVKSVSSRQSRQSGGNGGLGIEKQLRIPIPDHVDVTTNAPSDDDVRRNELRKEGDSTVMAMDTELVVSEIGEIAEAECIGTSGDDKNNKDTNIMSINNNTSCVDATVQVLDSMIIGRVETGVINDGEKKEETTGDAVKVLDMDQGMDRKLDQVREVGQVMDVDDSDMIES